jgi:predicted lysophospholipase L1 biosynthesis ABC-type transport system permease subunit
VIARLVFASLRRRFRQLALIFVAVAVAAATVAALAGFSARIGDRLAADLAAFGPNLTVRPQVGSLAAIPAAALARVRALPGVVAATGAAATGAEAGTNAGAAADARFMRLDVRAEPRRLEEVARRIEAAVEGVEARPLRKTAQSDAQLTRRLQLLLGAVSAVSFLLALLAVGAATTALVGERRVEIGLMLALGYTGRRIGLFLAAELLAAALAGALAGAALGELAAGDLAARLAGSLGPAAGGGTLATWSGFAAAAAVAVAVVGASMMLALNRLQQLDAARILRGE